MYKAEKPINVDDYFWDNDNKVQKYKIELDYSNFQLKAPIKLSNNDKLTITFHKYNKYNGHDLNIIDNIINSKKGSLILGSAGTGKTYLINQLIKKIDGKKMLRLAPTNKSALLINGQTLDKFAYNMMNSKTNSTKYKKR